MARIRQFDDSSLSAIDVDRATTLAASDVEQLEIAFLDAQGRLLGRHALLGDIGTVALPVRRIIADALALDAAALLLAHNHPSGDPTPSRADLAATRRLADVAHPLGLRIADHLVFGRGGCRSFRKLGLL